ncbi:hypothetical protein NECAME_18573 [Necator americanus]|uniref:Uncharacterized protein n=1 Tax=Necator americanus TaxID=51031 RepID=W2STA6_NECAM|nr:hypothetical protein NECAME_18573 [Necator americanus]ETN72984.1 hypothetical protein NECAME_18573 [Necator americanus]
MQSGALEPLLEECVKEEEQKRKEDRKESDIEEDDMYEELPEYEDAFNESPIVDAVSSCCAIYQ